MARYVTDTEAEKIPGFSAIPSADERSAVLEAAERVYGYVAKNPWVGETQLREWGERNDVGPGRMNTVLAILASSQRLYSVADATPVGATAAGVPLREALEALKLDQLRDLARDQGVSAPTTLKKDELVSLLAGEGRPVDDEERPILS